ncbi:MAG: hypothetical protein H6707_13740 [Deltaproteobacteria bacterium]|nr:hypothetical protein [Deltaproteobacteria bacterium]
MRCAVLSWFLATLALFGGVAHARDVVCLPPAITPAKAPELIARFHDALAAGLRSGGLPVLPAAVVRKQLKIPLTNAGCASGPCVLSARGFFREGRIATAEVNSVGKNYTFVVRLHSERNTVIGEATSRCDICTLKEALQALTKAAADVGSKAEEPPEAAPAKPAPPVPAATPAPAPTPTPAPTPAATPAKPPVAAMPAPAPASPTQAASTRGSTRRWPLWPGIVSAAVGAASLGGGIAMLSLDGRYTNCVGPARADGRNCADIYNTSTAGWVLTGMGGAALAASGVLFYLYFSSDSGEHAASRQTPAIITFAPQPGGVMFAATGAF